MSKSGLFAHFGSKQELQLATVERRRRALPRRGDRARARAAPTAPRACGRWPSATSTTSTRLYSGGCFWAATSAEYDDRPGPGPRRDRRRARRLARRARAPGRVAGVERPERFAFELYAVVMGANSRYRLSGDRRVFDYAREALDRLEAELPE